MAGNSEKERNGISEETERPLNPQLENFRMPNIEEARAQEIWNNCAFRSVASGVMGGAAGLFFGMLLGSLETPLYQDDMSSKQKIVYQAKQMGRKSWGNCKAFALMGLVFSATECIVEKARAKHDIKNTVVAGCVTGGSMSARAGPQAACVGCAGFAAFSVLIEKFIERHS